MIRPALPVLAVLAAAIAFSAAARAQDFIPNPSQFAAGADAPVQRAALDSAAASGASTMFAGLGQSTITTQAAPVVSKPQGNRRPLSSVGIAVKVGAAGVGFDVATPLAPGWLNLRGGASFFSYDAPQFTTNNIDVNGSLKFQNASAMIDLFPFRGFLRLSGGVTVANDTHLSARLNVPAGQSFRLGDQTYYSSTTDPIHGTAAFGFGGKTAGRVSIGTGNMLPRKGHLRFETEFGVQFFTQPTVVYTVMGSGCASATDPTSCGPVEPSDVVAEQNKLQSDLTDLKYFPIVSFGLSYKFH